MVADDIRRAIETATRLTLPTVTALLWRAFGEERITEAEAEALSALIEARQVSPRSGENPRSPILGNGTSPNPADQTPTHSVEVLRSPGLATSMPADPALVPDRQRSPRTGVGSRPRTDASLERRRRWAASGRIPPALAARFTLAEQAALALISAETARKGDCRLAIERMAAVAGVSRSTVKAAIREARKLGLLTVEERKVAGWRNDTNVVRIVSQEWTAWLRLARKGKPTNCVGLSARPGLRGGGVKFLTTTLTQISKPRKTRTARPPRGRIAVIDRTS